MSNKKNAPDVLRDGARIVGGKDKFKVIESPPNMTHEKERAVLVPGKKRFDRNY